MTSGGCCEFLEVGAGGRNVPGGIGPVFMPAFDVVRNGTRRGALERQVA
jgi:hypothetical protein